MAVAIFRSRWNQTPQGPQDVNWGHPLARNLVAAVVFDHSGAAYDLVRHWPFTPVGTPAGAVASGIVGGAYLSTNVGALNTAPWNGPSFDSGITVFARMLHTATPHTDATLFGVLWQNVANPPYGVGYFQMSSGVLIFVTNNVASQVNLSTGAGVNLLVPQTYSAHASPLGQSFLTNGVRVLDNTTATAPSAGSNACIGIGDFWAVTRNPSTIMDVGYVFNGANLKGAGLEELHDNPFALIQPRKAKIYSFGSVSATVALTGVSATGAVGSFGKASTVALTGVSATGAVGLFSTLLSRAPTGHITFIHAVSANAGTGSSSVASPSFTSGTGNLLVVAVADATRLITGTPVTDNKGNVFQLAWVRGTTPGSTSPKALYYATNIVGGAGHIVTFTPQGGTDPCAIGVAEFSGVDSDTPFNLVSTAASSAVPHVSGTVTTTSPAEQLLIGSASVKDQQVLPPASAPGFFTDVVALHAGGGEGVLASYAIVDETDQYRYEYTFENGGTDLDACGIATFRGTDIAFVQSTYKQAVLSGSTVAITTTPGHFIVIIAAKNYGSFASPITDSFGNTWQVGWTVASGRAACYYAENIAGGAGHTFTVTISDEGNPILNKCTIAVLEFSGVNTSSALDRFASADTTSEPRSSGLTAITSQASELLIGGGGVSNLSNIPYSTINGIWTDVAAMRPVISGGAQGLILSYRIIQEAGTYEYGFHNGQTTAQNVGIATFQAAVETIDGGGEPGDGIDPAEDDSVCGAEVPLFFCELRTNSGFISYSWVDQPINEPTIQRKPRIVAMSTLRRELSDWNGRLVINGGTITLTDYAGDIRALIQSNTIIRKQIDFYLFDAANLPLLGTSPSPRPFRVGQYLVTSYRLGADMTVALTFEDRFGGDSLRDLLSKPLPYRTLDTSFNLDLPTALKGKGEPIPYGILSDEDIGFPTVQVWYTGPRTMPDTTTWYEGLIAGCATSGPISVWGSDGSLTAEGNPRQVKMDPAYYDTDIAMPGMGTVWTGYFGSTVYRVFNNRRYTAMYFKVGSAIGEAFKLFGTTNGSEGVPVHVNMGGVEAIGNATGNVITSLFHQWQHLITNFVEQNHATDENWYEIPLTPNDPQYSVVDTASVARAKLRSEVRLGGGYLGAFVIGHDLERLPLGEWFQRICLGGDVDMGIDRHGRMMLSMEDPAMLPVMDFTIVDTLQDTYRPPEKDYSKLANVIKVNTLKNLVQTNASVTLRPSAPQEVPPSAQWLTVAEQADDEDSINDLGGAPVGVREFTYEDWVTRDFAQLTQASVQSHRLERSRNGPDFHVVETDLCGLDVELGQQFTITHYAGLVPTSRRIRCTAIELEPPDPFRKTWAVRLFGYDTSTISTPEVIAYTLTVDDGSGDGVYATGVVVTITADAPPSGQVFYRWTGGSGIANRASASTTITMPGADTDIAATYITDATLFTLTVVDGSGGGNYATGAVVTIVANAPPSGYTFYAWTGDTVANASASTTTITIGSAAALVTATYTWFGIELAWDAGSSSDAIDGYEVVWGTSSGVYTSSVALGVVTSYRLTGLTVGVTYYVSVAAHNAAGYSAYATEVSDVPTLHFP